MGGLRPDLLLRNITEITPELLESRGIRAVFLDVDNTLTSYLSHEPAPGTQAWAEELQKKGLTVFIVSNNAAERVRPMAARYGLPFVSRAVKPLPFGFLRAKRKTGARSRQCLAVGDQIFTDVLGAKLCGMQTALLEPIEPETGWSFRLRRHFERPLRRRWSGKKRSKESNIS